MQAFIAVTGMAGMNTDKLAVVLSKLAAIQTVASAAIKIGNALQKQSALWRGIEAAKTWIATTAKKAHTVATVANTGATTAATIAQKAYNIALMACPYVAIAAAVVGLSYGIYKLVDAEDKASEAEKRRKKELEDQKRKTEMLNDVNNAYTSTLSSNYSQLMTKFASLQASYKNLSSNMEKVKWIKEHQNELTELELKVDNVKDAENVFNGNTNAVVEGFKARAKAAALAAKAAALYAKQMELEQQYLDHYSTRAKRAGDEYKGTSVNADTPGSKRYDFNHYEANYGNIETRNGGRTWTYTAKGAAEANKKLAETDITLQNIQSDYNDINKEIDQTINKMVETANAAKKYQSTNTKKTPKGGSDKKKDYAQGSLQDLENQLSELQSKWKAGKLKIDKTEYDRQVKELEDAISDKKIELGIDVANLVNLEQRLDRLKKQYKNGLIKITPDDYEKKVQELEAQIKDIRVRIGVQESPELQKLIDLQAKLQQLKSKKINNSTTTSNTSNNTVNNTTNNQTNNLVTNVTENTVKDHHIVDVEVADESELEKLKEKIGDLPGVHFVEVDVDESQVDETSGDISKLPANHIVQIQIDDESQFEEFNKRVAELPASHIVNVDINVDDAEIAEVEKQISELSGKVNIHITPELQEIIALEAQLQNLEDDKLNLRVDLDEVEFNKQKNDLIAQITQLKISVGMSLPTSEVEKQLNDFKKAYADGLVQILPADYKKKVDELEKAIRQRKVALGLELEIQEGSDKEISQKISDIQAKIAVTADPATLKQLKDELAELEEKKRVINFKIEATDLESFKRGLKDIMAVEMPSLIVNVEYKTKTEKAVEAAKALEDRYTNLRKYLDDNAKAFETVKNKAAGLRTEAEQDFYNTYVKATTAVNQLGEAYVNAANKANKLQIDKLSWEGFKKGVSAIGNVTSSIDGMYSSWKNMAEQWNDMSSFEQTMSVIENVCSTFETLIGMYESVTEVIKIFDSISQAAAASKVASNAAVMTSETSLMATESANTATKIANNTAEQTSNMGVIATESGASIAKATSSGAGLPFPANIAAIAAGIAAVVAALAMISSFADGGILGGPTTVGDRTLFYGNKGEMVLNNRQ